MCTAVARETVAEVKKWTTLALMLMYIVFAVWWFAVPKHVLSSFVQLGATEAVCVDSGAYRLLYPIENAPKSSRLTFQR